jgi:Arc/MetJ-type ribon-helix-helix transcriptional regulator
MPNLAERYDAFLARQIDSGRFKNASEVVRAARSDLSGIRGYIPQEHGRTAADSYTALLKQALRDIREDPYRPGGRERG